MKSNWRWTALITFILLSLAALYFRDVLTGKYILIERDLAYFFLPQKFLWLEQIKNGTFPLWNPYHLNGHPFFATLHEGLLYPSNILYFFLPFDLAFNYSIVLQFFLAGLFTFLLVRHLNASYSASLISAVTFMLSGYLISILGMPNHMLSTPWAPLVILLFLIGLRKGSLRFIIFSGLAVCAMFLGGGVEVVYVTLVIICFLLFLTPLTSSMEKDRQHDPWTLYNIKLRLCYLGIFLTIFFGLSAIQLLPFMELTAHTNRVGGLSYSEATLWSIHPRDLLQFFMPDLYGYRLRIERYWEEQNWLKSIYLGTIPFLLTLFFFVKRGRKEILFYSIVIAGSLILAFGRYTPIHHFFYEYVPFFNKIRYPAKFLFLMTIAISVTAGLGYDRLMLGIREKIPSARRLVYGISAFSLVAVIMFGCLNFFETPISDFLHLKGYDKPHYNDLADNISNMKRLLCLTAIFGLVVFIGFKFQPVRKFMLPIAVVSLLTFDLFFAHQGFYLKTLSKTYHGTSSNIDFILSDKSLFRIFVTPETINEPILVASSTKGKGKDITNLDLERITPGLGIERHIFDIWGWEVMPVKRTKDLDTLIIAAPSLDSTNLLDLMNVKYVISSTQITSNKLKMVKMNIPDMTELDREMEIRKNYNNPDAFSNKRINTVIEQFYMSKVKIYQNLNCLPRAFLVQNYKVVSSEEEYHNILGNREFNPSELLLLEENPVVQQGQEQKQKKIVDKVKIIRYNTNLISLQANTGEPKFLFMSETYYPGWKAYIDGERAHIYRANYAFRAVFLKPGEHKVEFVYDPWTFKVGLTISIITMIGVIVLLIRFV
jgi:hypothetical protein